MLELYLSRLLCGERPLGWSAQQAAVYLQDVVSAVAPETPTDTTLPKVDTDKIARREAKAVEVCCHLLQQAGEMWCCQLPALWQAFGLSQW